MKIEETVTKWFSETAAEMSARSKGDKYAYNLCSNVLPVVHNYSSAVFLLLNDNRKLPAMALIRVLAELILRFTWCLSSGKKGENVDVRIKRWWKESCRQQKQSLEKFLCSADIAHKEEVKKHIKWLEDEISKIPHKYAGDLYSSLEDLTVQSSKMPSWKNDLYPKLYTRFNQAVHPDLIVLSRLVKQSGDTLVFHGDDDTVNTDVIKIYCMSWVFNAIALTRIVYGLSYDAAKMQYLEIKKRFKEK